MGDETARKRTIRLTGLGASLEDSIGNLNDVASIARSSEEREEIAQLVRELESAKDDIKRLCRAWSRSFDVYE